MFRSFQQHVRIPGTRARHYSQTFAVRNVSASQQSHPATDPPPPVSAANSSTGPTTTATRPYFVPRNTKGSIPVYTDIRNSNRYLILIRNVEGNVDALAKDLTRELFPPDSPEAARLRIQAVRSRHLILRGGRWKHDVIRWLQSKGF